MGGPGYTPTATATSGLVVTLTIDSSSSSICSISGGVVTFQAVGTCTIDANQGGDSNWNPALQTQQFFSVGKGSQTVIFTSTAPSGAAVDGATYVPSATATSGLPVTITVDAASSGICSITSGVVSFQAVGTCTLDGNQSGDANWNAASQAQQSFTVGKGSQTVSFTSSAPGSATVGGITYVPTAAATSGLTVSITVDSSASSVCSMSAGVVSFQAVGTCVLNANQAGNANWNPAPQVQQSFSVGQGSQTITFTSTAPSGAVVGGPTYTPTATASSGLPVTFTIDPSSASVCSISGGVVSFLGAGTCTIDANQGGDANYLAAPQVQQAFTVSAASLLSQSISFTSTPPSNATVGGPTYTPTATATSGLTVTITVDSSSSAICSISGGVVSFQNVGTCTLDANQAGNGTYAPAPQVQQSFNVVTQTIVQAAPTSNSTTTTASSSFTDQLNSSAGTYYGAVTYVQSTGSAYLTVSSSGGLKTTGTLAVGSYTATGTTSDAYGDTGVFSYTLTVNPVTITQTAPTSNSTTTVASASFTDQLNTASNNGPVTYTVTSGASGIVVTSSGAVSTTGTLSSGSYTVTGNTSDSYGDSGTFAYTLTVTPVTISQGAPSANNTTTVNSSTFTDQLTASGTYPATVTFSQTIGSADLLVASNGAVSTTGALSAGTYTASGTTADGYGDTGTFSYTLTVSPDSITQGAPLGNSTNVAGSSGFTDALKVTSGFVGSVTWNQTSGSPALVVSPSGNVTTSGYLSVGSYTASGTTSDGYGDAGSFTYTLTVNPTTINQIAPTSNTTTTTASATFTDQLNVSGGTGPVTFVVTSAPGGLNVSSTGAVSTTGVLPAGTYSVSGATSDGYGDTGTFTYTLTVNSVTITQGAPTSGSTTTVNSAAFTAQLTVTGTYSGTVTFFQLSGTPDLSVSPSGLVSTSGYLTPGTYTATGSTSDGYGDTGTFTYTLTVVSDTIVQGSPTSGSVDVAGSAGFADTLSASAGFVGTVIFTQTSGASSILVSSGGAVTTTGVLVAGTYTAGGVMSDGYGDTGNFTYTLTVTPDVISQGAPTSASTTPLSSSGFTDTLTSSSGYVGSVAYTQTTGSSYVLVSGTGAVSTVGSLPVGTYTATGTTADGYGDTGTFSFTLDVVAGVITQSSPTANSIDVAGSRAFIDQLNAQSGSYLGTLTWNQTSGSADLIVGTNGSVSTVGYLATGTYIASGTTHDSYGDMGTFTYTLTVTPDTITQGAPVSNSTTVTASSSFTDQLTATSGFVGTLSWHQTSGGANLVVATNGAVTTSGSLPVGRYTATGTVSDAYGDSGSWTYTLNVNASTITQGAPTTGSVDVAGSPTFTDQLTSAPGFIGTVNYTQTTGSAALAVAGNGAVSTTGTLPVGTYTATGTTLDSYGDSGTFTYTLTVSPDTIVQGSPITGTTTPPASSSFTDHLAVTSGYVGTVTYTQTAGFTYLTVSGSGAVSASVPLAVGDYVASGTTADSYGDTGTFTYTLTVSPDSIVQGAPLSNSTTTASSSAFTDQLNPTSGFQGAVTWDKTAGSADLLVTSSGAISTTGLLGAGNYTVSGTTTDAYGDSGTFSYTLTVNGVTISQAAPNSNTTTTVASSGFTDQLNTTGNMSAVSFTTTSAPNGLVVSSTGAVSTTGTLSAGTYTVSGTTSDSLGDSGVFGYSLTVNPVTIMQGAPTSGSDTTVDSNTFSANLTVASGFVGAVTYTQSAGAADILVSGNGLVTTTGTLLSGTYVASGTTSDAFGDTGTFTYTLTINRAAQTITFTSTPPSDAVTGEAGYSPTATSSSLLPVALSIDSTSSGVCSLSSGVITFLAAGTCLVDANQTGNGMYSPAPQVQQSFAIEDAQTITFTTSPPNPALVGDSYTPGAKATSGLPVSLRIAAGSASVCSLSGGVIRFLGVGNCVVDANQAGNSTYAPAPEAEQTFAIASVPPLPPTPISPPPPLPTSQTQPIPTDTTLISSNPSPAKGQTVTFTASVTSADGVPTGTVNFIWGTTVICSDVPLINGRDTCNTNSLAVGTDNVVARYQGNSNFDPSASAPYAQLILAPASRPARWTIHNHSRITGGIFVLPGSTTGVHSIRINWGDGHRSKGSLHGRAIFGAHTYLKSGRYRVTITFLGKNGHTYVFSHVIVVSIPSAGFPWWLLGILALLGLLWLLLALVRKQRLVVYTREEFTAAVDSYRARDFVTIASDETSAAMVPLHLSSPVWKFLSLCLRRLPFLRHGVLKTKSSDRLVEIVLEEKA